MVVRVDWLSDRVVPRLEILEEPQAVDLLVARAPRSSVHILSGPLSASRQGSVAACRVFNDCIPPGDSFRHGLNLHNVVVYEPYQPVKCDRTSRRESGCSGTTRSEDIVRLVSRAVQKTQCLAKVFACAESRLKTRLEMWG